jgi:uncharacterized RDD family membrane protein YckC
MLCVWCSAPLPPRLPQQVHGGPAAAPGYLGPAQGEALPALGAEFLPAGEAFFRRLVAWFLDYSLVLGLPILILVIGTATGNPELVKWPFMGMMLAGAIGNFHVMGSNGQTLGKKLLGIRVIGPDGDKPGFGRNYRRMQLLQLSLLIAGLGCLWMLWDENQQTWHDKWADTMVVRA